MFYLNYYNNILLDISFYKISRKYELLNIKQKPEMQEVDKITNLVYVKKIKKTGNYELFNKILNKITIGTSKGSLFRFMGKPHYCLENNDEEIWSFVSYYYSIYIVLKNNIVIDRYICETSFR